MSASGNVRSVAAVTLDRVLTSKHPVDRFLERADRSVTARDRALLHELVLGTLRWLRRLDEVIASASARAIESIDVPLRNPLRLAVYQILFLDRIPSHAAVHEAVDEARRRTHRGGSGFVNAVLRKVAGSPQLESWPVEATDPLRHLAIETSHPDLLVERWWRQFGETTTRQLLAANNLRKPWQLLTFRAKGGREDAAERLAAEGVHTNVSAVSPLGLVVSEGNPLETSLFDGGDIYLQDEASQAAAWIPPPVPGERVVDLAAAPGGKTLSLLAWESEIEVWAADRNLHRLRTLRENRQRLDQNFELLQSDALLPPLTCSFDRVVLDLPCSGTGTLRKHPELKWRIDPSEIGRLSARGLEMIEAGSGLVRRGGLLCVITCSLEPEENTQVVDRFLGSHHEFEPVSLAEVLPEPLDRWIEGPGAWQILPADAHDGFTVHALRRRG